MGRTIHVGAMPSALSGLASGSTSGTAVKPSAGLGFLDLAAREIAKNGDTPYQTGFERSEMSIQQYKQYISGRISAIEIDPSRALESLAVKISDAGFAAMKDDPEYEKWVLDTLEAAWSTPAANGISGAYTTYSIGADRDSFRTNTIDFEEELDVMKQLDKLNSQEPETFWERRHRHHEEYMELIQREALLRRMRNGTVSTAELLLGGLV